MPGTTGLVAAILGGFIGKGGVQVANESKQVIQYRDNPLKMVDALAYRSDSTTIINILVHNQTTQQWKTAGAVLRSRSGRQLKGRSWQEGPISPGAYGRIFVERTLTDEQARVTYTVELWSEDGRKVTIGNVTFPVVPGAVK